MPRIVGQLGGFTYYSWVFSAFLLAQSTTTVIYGKLSDIYGRKPILIGGIVLFLVGSLLCGFAWSMMSLVAFRLLQASALSAIQPVTSRSSAIFYKLEERGRAQGLMASVWATSAVIGPLAGGIIVDNLSWAWIFWINIPVARDDRRLRLLPAGDDRAAAGPDRLSRRGALLRGGRLAARRPDRDGGGPFDPRRCGVFVPRQRRAVPVAGAAGGGADHLDRPLGAPAGGDQQCRIAADRHGPDRLTTSCRSMCRACWAARRSSPASP